MKPDALHMSKRASDDSMAVLFSRNCQGVANDLFSYHAIVQYTRLYGWNSGMVVTNSATAYI